MKLNEEDLTTQVQKQFVGECKGIDTAKRTITALVSTDSVDRDGDVIVPAGWQLENYRKNPVVLWAHRYDQLPIAKALAIEPAEHGLLAMMQFAEHQLAQDVFDLYAGGFLRAFSVGFRVLEYTRRQDAQAQTGWLIMKAELLEFSAVPVPANQDALVLAAKAAKLCGLKCGCTPVIAPARPADAEASAVPVPAPVIHGKAHYLDLAEHTSPADAEEQAEAAAQTGAAIEASVAELNQLTQRLEQGG